MLSILDVFSARMIFFSGFKKKSQEAKNFFAQAKMADMESAALLMASVLR